MSIRRSIVVTLTMLVAPGAASAGGRCTANVVAEDGSVDGQADCAHFDATTQLGRGARTLSAGARVRGKRVTAEIVSIEVGDQAFVGMAGSTAPIPSEPGREIELHLVGKAGKREKLFYWLPGCGVTQVDDVIVSKDGRLVAIVYEPDVALRDFPSQKLRTTAVFDLRARLPTLD